MRSSPTPSPDAYERLVDRLLASPAYAERMADYWLDLARFSETDGFLDDHHDRLLWPWRDWVIESFARNRPFDEFGTWQLAGDLLPDATREQVLATAYLARRQAHDRERRDRCRVQSRVHGRAHGQRARGRVLGAHGRLRALPRPQIRPDQADRLLLARRILQQQRRARCLRAGVQRHSRRPDAAVARRRDGRGTAGRGGRGRRAKPTSMRCANRSRRTRRGRQPRALAS